MVPMRAKKVLVLDFPFSDYENEDDDEDEKFAPPATIWTDAYRQDSALRPRRKTVQFRSSCRALDLGAPPEERVDASFDGESLFFASGKTPAKPPAR